MSQTSHVCVRIGKTLNMGNYESLKVEEEICIPCEATPEARSEAHQNALAECDKKLHETITLEKQAFRR